jgi:hypothetical protein
MVSAAARSLGPSAAAHVSGAGALRLSVTGRGARLCYQALLAEGRQAMHEHFRRLHPNA